MKLTLHQLNLSYQALTKLAGREFPKEHHKLAYAIARVVRSAKPEIDALAESLEDLARKCGVGPAHAPDQPPNFEGAKEYNEQALELMKETEIELWGDPIPFERIAGVVPISPMELALLDWLIADESPTRAE